MSEQYHELTINQQCKNCGKWNQSTMAHPPKFVERMHSNHPDDKDFILLKCSNCKN